MAGKTVYLQNKIIDNIFRGQAALTLTNVYVGLLTAAPTDSSAGTEVTTNGTPSMGYNRATVACSASTWSATQATNPTPSSATPSSGGGATLGSTTFNSATITIGTTTVSGNWTPTTQIGWFGIYDAATSGNLLYWGSLTAPKSVNIGDQLPTFAVGALTITED
jgi:hypothetical protein